MALIIKVKIKSTMESKILRLSEKLKSIKSEELLERFRSKDDLYRYITTSSKNSLEVIKLSYRGIIYADIKSNETKLFESHIL